MQLGAFSASLAVTDIAASREFYEKLGFQAFAGVEEQGWLVLRNGETVIGLFQGMFERNTLTFNPGWDQHCNTLEQFDDVRSIQERVKDLGGIEFASEADPNGTGPASFCILDPDGNPILFDQHV